MLTENQIERLTILKEEFPEYSLIVDDCISTWKNEGLDPSNRYGFGVHSENNIFLTESKSCIIGASLQSYADYGGSLVRIFATKYNISESDACLITGGFDVFGFLKNDELVNSRAYQFGYKIAEGVL